MSLSAPHSSTIVEETIKLLRTLHRAGGGWNARINEFICLKMAFVNEIITEIPILQMQMNEWEEPAATAGGAAASGSGETNFTAQQAAVISCLSLIGGFDPRPRIGGRVQTEDGGRGVVAGINYQVKQAVDFLSLKRSNLTLL